MDLLALFVCRESMWTCERFFKVKRDRYLLTLTLIFVLFVDLHLIFNLVSASTSFQTAESWTPICLPRFDNR